MKTLYPVQVIILENDNKVFYNFNGTIYDVEQFNELIQKRIKGE